MDIKFSTRRRLSKRLLGVLEKEFGFEIELDCEDDGDFEYFFGYSADNVEEGDEDPLDYDEAVRCCGVLKRYGIENFAIEGNGSWAMGMIQAKDFSRYAMTGEEKKEQKRISNIFWSEAGKERKLK